MDNQKFYDYILNNHNVNKEQFNNLKMNTNYNDDKDIYELFLIYISLLNKENVNIESIINDLFK
jgi:hypothetical protein